MAVLDLLGSLLGERLQRNNINFIVLSIDNLIQIYKRFNFAQITIIVIFRLPGISQNAIFLPKYRGQYSFLKFF